MQNSFSTQLVQFERSAVVVEVATDVNVVVSVVVVVDVVTIVL